MTTRRDIIYDTETKALDMNPEEVEWTMLKFAEKALREAEDYIARGDVVQASEKLYEAVEECVKANAETFKVEVLLEVDRRVGTLPT